MAGRALRLPSGEDRAQARDLLAQLARGSAPQVQDLPPGVTGLLQRLLGEVAQGHAIQLVPVHTEPRTQEAADLPGVSRPHLVKLLAGVSPTGRWPPRARSACRTCCSTGTSGTPGA